MFNDILIPIDLNDDSSWSKSLPTAVAFCRQFGSNLHVVTVLPDFGMSIVGQFFPAGYDKTVAAQVLEQLHGFVREHVPEDIQVQHIVAKGTVYEQILQVGQKIDADLIVLASHRPELSDYLLGPNAARVVRHADCSVMVVRG